MGKAWDAGLHNRLFHRYPVELSAKYVHDGAQVCGTLTNVSVGGAFVKTNVFPEVGKSIQLTIAREEAPLIELNVVVVRTVDSADGGEAGFGCNVFEAISNVSEAHLCAALKELFGMSNVRVRATSNALDNSVCFIHRFPKLDLDDKLFPESVEPTAPAEQSGSTEPVKDSGASESVIASMVRRINDLRKG